MRKLGVLCLVIVLIFMLGGCAEMFISDEFKPDHKWYDIFDVALTTGVGYRRLLPLKVVGNAHGLENFYLQLEPLGRPIN